MVKICATVYPAENEAEYSEYFEKYPYPLSSFQKWAIEAIVSGNHVLVTAHTGSGKTLPAEFAIEHFAAKNPKKKVIYTSPIKALSNQKYYEFSQKIPHISFGILTGDIKTNPEADVLIMTTEILMNTLYFKTQKGTSTDTNISTSNQLMFDIDFDTELACVIFDEVHYINDAHRGHVWEETIMMLPPKIQMVMLSATLDSPEKFAEWCETRGQPNNITEATNKNKEKTVYLATTYERVVPLTHYSFITCTQGIFKHVKDKQLAMEIMKTTNSLHVIQDAKGKFVDANYQKVERILDVFEEYNHFVKRQHVLNTVSKHMVDHNMLPAICFVLSRKALEQCAREVTTVLLEDDSKVPYIVRRDCEQIIRKLPNYEEYLRLPEYVNLVSLLEKGVAIHHAGMMPILREMVELLFAKGYIKLLFATETFAVGINMPTKTVLFTDCNKFDGSVVRPLLPHEYTQMAGRAGRRGIDTIGNVIHLTNLFKNSDKIIIKTMLAGKPQTLVSKFKVSYHFVFNMIQLQDQEQSTITKYLEKSMIQTKIVEQSQAIKTQIAETTADTNNLNITINSLKTPVSICGQYAHLQRTRLQLVNKKRKEAERELTKIVDEYKTVEKDTAMVAKWQTKKQEIVSLNEELEAIQNTLTSELTTIIGLLEDQQFLTNEPRPVLTKRGQIASHFKEIHCLIFAYLIDTNQLQKFNATELVGILSCFTNVSTPEEKRDLTPKSSNTSVQQFLVEVGEMYLKQQDVELRKNIVSDLSYEIHYDLLDYAMEWTKCETEQECKFLLQTISSEKDIFLGEFIKAILKINTIAAELEKVAEMLGDMAFLSVVKRIPALTLKYVATNQSLYI